ncbi:hypothetical protein NKH37_23090 [Mesorhizobium sp. M1217]|uniref:hypothetical protein n=1 Tax=Mesorhizobium sp. M1217 TaxID=2957070 RepID=UPI0033350358
MVRMSDDEQTAAARWSVKSELRAVGRASRGWCWRRSSASCAFIAGPIVCAVLAINGIAGLLQMKPVPAISLRSAAPRLSAPKLLEEEDLS